MNSQKKELSSEMLQHHREWMRKQLTNAYDSNALITTAEKLVEQTKQGLIKDAEFIDRIDILFEIYRARTEKENTEC